ncbi:5'-nucleotidase [Microbacterium sp. cf046]|uniref:bifunctional metallophosphatase/5'-nucleotidase n=1 Tax=Microbacterium sp. cf046 TaxID=1761803 RepID=UPI0008EE5363|nr:bifunctional UDP-sugar hydrolase/5'-nucleotidase [Microbacterium sp. cf046]SFS04010.1 5'-nucleotidase [Microbacterium sp. cf046]
MRSRSETRSHNDRSTTPTRRRIAVGAAATVFALAAGAIAAPAAQAADPVLIDLVTVNDFHGRIEASAPSGGIAALATAVNQIRATNPNTVFAAAGDMIGASTFTSFIQNDVPTIETLNAAGLDVSAAGNHEFDKGWEDLRDRVLPMADWEYISANVWDTETDDYALAPYWTETLGGITIGFIGAVTEELPALVSPAGIATLDVNPVVESVNAVADQLSDGDAANDEADVLVLLVHEGATQPTLASATDLNTPFGKIVAGVSDDVDAIVSGHTHLAYNLVIDGRPVISSGQYGERFSDMKIQVDPDTKEILSMSNTTYAMYTQPAGTPPPPPVPNYIPGPAEQPIVTLVAEAVAYAKVAGGVKVGDITASFQRGLQPRTPTPADPSTIQEARGAESTLGNFVADVQLDQTQVRFPDTQLAFMNPGGLRADMKYPSSGADDPDGNVTYAEAAGVQPFANTLVTLTLTGAQVKSVLEEQWQPSGASRPFLKLGVSKGLTYVTDYDAPAGSRITNLEFNGVPVDPAAQFRVVVNSFLASGGDNFVTLAQGTDRADSGLVDLEAMVSWFATNGEASPDLAQRSIGVELTGGTTGVYSAGQTVKVNLSSLDFTQTPTPAGTVTVAVGGVEVGTAPVDSSLVPLTDEAGRASLEIVIPDGTPTGTVPLTITTPTGTSFDVPIEIVQGIKTTITAKSSGGKNGDPFVITATVKARGTVATGEVGIYIDGFPPALGTLQDGRVTFQLPDLARGKVQVHLVYFGDGAFEASETTLKLNVK